MDRSKLDLFDEHATCPKCGCADVSTHFCGKAGQGDSHYVHRRDIVVLGLPDPYYHPFEFIWRQCGRCSFGWPELPLEAAEIAEEGGK